MDVDLDPQLKLNPLLTIWLHPRQTISKRIAITPDPTMYILAGLAGVSNAFYQAFNQHSGDTASLGGVIAKVVIGGIICGLITLAVAGSLFRWTGKWIGGKASA